jgi:FtsP/CotA-like multicopper oxidase with cupredoxin domain
MQKALSRREFISRGAAGVLGVAVTAGLASACAPDIATEPSLQTGGHNMHASAPNVQPAVAMGGGMQHGENAAAHGDGLFMPGFVGEIDHAANGFNPTAILTDFDYGVATTLPNGQTQREYHIFAENKVIEVAPGIQYEAWTYNGRVPGPTIRCRDGDHLRIVFTNVSTHPHTMHFHGIHAANMDGVYEPVPVGGTFVYEFDAGPFGVHQYHCHIFPLAEHIARGLYGAFIVDPKDGWPKAGHEFVMVQNGIDIDFDGQNDFYAVNFIPFHYDKHPIQIRKDTLVRIFLINMLEFDPINSFHIHANFFNYYPTGTSRTPSEFTDTIVQGQAQRGMLEFTYGYTGKFMFHAHKTEFAELGWTGIFDVVA